MSQSAKDFLCQWVAQNIHDEPYVRIDALDPRPAALAVRCEADGEAEAWTDEQLCKAASDLDGAGSPEACMALKIDICAQKHLAEIALLRSWRSLNLISAEVSVCVVSRLEL